MHLYINIITYYAIILYITMDLEVCKKLVELQMYSDGTLHQIQEAKKNYENNKIDQEFENIKRFKQITDSNKELIDRIEKKTNQSDELIKKITDALPYYNQNVQPHEQLTLDDKTTPKPSPSRSLGIMNIFNNNEEREFINNLIEGNKVCLYSKKTGDKSDDIYTDTKLLDLNKLTNYSNKELSDVLASKKLGSLTKQLSGVKSHHNTNEISTYIRSLSKYKDAIKDYLKSTKYENKNDDTQSEPTTAEATEVEDEGITREKRNGYKIVNSKYNNKLLINIDKLMNEMIVEAKLDDDILYTNKGDIDTINILTKHFNPKKYTVN